MCSERVSVAEVTGCEPMRKHHGRRELVEDPRNQLIKMASDAELERRWSVVRQVMREKGIDYLVMQNSEEFLGGTLRWFTDWVADIGFPYTVIYPVDDDKNFNNWGFERPQTTQYPTA